MECSINGCAKPRATAKRGYCTMHDMRVLRHGSPHVTLRITEGGLKERLLARVIPSESPDRCWGWSAATNDKGYGQFWFDGRLRYAHRASWEIANGKPPPEGMLVRHSCDNPPCANPRHLLIGTVADNTADMISRGRGVQPTGVANGRAKLNPDVVREIRRLHRSGWTKSAIARLVGCAQPTIKNVVIGKTWAHVADSGDVIPVGAADLEIVEVI